MNLNFDITIPEFKKQLETEKRKPETESSRIVIWGSGSLAAKFRKELDGCRGCLAYYVDKSDEKWNTKIENLDVKPPEYLLGDHSVDTVVIATMYFQEVLEELEENGFRGNVYSAFHLLMQWEEKFDYGILEAHLDGLKKLLADDKSKETAEFICRHRRERDLDFSEICEKNQYFLKDLVAVNPHAVFVDAGAYHGETMEEFMVFQDNQFDKIVAFEMDADNFKVLEEKGYDERVELYHYGLWDQRTSCTYFSDGTSSFLGGPGGGTSVPCIPLDEVIGDGEVTFLKMDIEGAERKALHGAEQCIRRCRPQLAISVYHRSDDLVEITKLIHEWLPEHRLFLRHHSVTYTETVLYAVP